MTDSSLILADDIQKYIYTIRGVQVMFDEELAKFRPPDLGSLI